MRLQALGLVLVAVSAVLTPAAAESPPPGSYQSTCTNVKVQKLLGGPGKNLTASCQKRDGKSIDALLALPCAGDIENKNGKLVCKPGPNPFAPPPGSYRKHCKDVSMAGPILRAACKTSEGFRVNTSINTLECRGRDIKVKKDGQLKCK